MIEWFSSTYTRILVANPNINHLGGDFVIRVEAVTRNFNVNKNWKSINITSNSFPTRGLHRSPEKPVQINNTHLLKAMIISMLIWTRKNPGYTVIIWVCYAKIVVRVLTHSALPLGRALCVKTLTTILVYSAQSN